jgi:hypothetical protein
MNYFFFIVVLFTSLALGQTSPPPQSDVSLGSSEHHRHDDDEEPPPASAASVLPDSAVITIKGLCDQPSGAAASSSRAAEQGVSAADANKKESVGSSADLTNSTCKTIVTKAQFEKLVDALNPQMPGPVRRQLAESYPRLLLFSNRARELGLDQDAQFAEMMRFASMQLLTQRLTRYFEQQASSISDSDIEKYYKENPIRFTRAELLRILIPKQSRQAQKPASTQSSADPVMLKLAEKIHARAAAGEDFQQLQKEAFEAAGISSGSPNVSTGKIGVTGLPLNHQIAFEMQPGQVSDVIADTNGYYIYKVVSKEMRPLSQTSKEIRKSIASQRVQDSIALLTNSLKSELNETYFGAYPRTSRPSGQNVSKIGEH